MSSQRPDYTDTDSLQVNQKVEHFKSCIGQSIGEKSKKRIAAILNDIEQLSDAEKFFLYIQLPNGKDSATDIAKPRVPGNMFGKKAELEVAQTYTWIQSHLEEDPTVSLQKHEVYEEYKRFCQASKFEQLCVADFGKAMKHVFPKVKPRRLGQRGNSKYCYSGLKMKLSVAPPSLPCLEDSATNDNQVVKNEFNSVEIEKAEQKSSTVDASSENVVLDWAGKMLDYQFMTIQELSLHLKHHCSVGSGKQHLKECLSEMDGENHSNREQRKKCPEHSSKIAAKATSNASGGKNKKSRKLTNAKVEANVIIAKDEQSVVAVKTEPRDDGPSFMSPRTVLPSISQVVAACPQNKLPMAYTATHVSPVSSISSIIVLPSLPQVKMAGQPSSTDVTSPGCRYSNTASPFTLKYKKIQPKPDGVSRSCSATESFFALNYCDEASLRRRHSLSTIDGHVVAASVTDNGNNMSDHQVQQAKRHSDEQDAAASVSKKRFVDMIQISNAEIATLEGVDIGLSIPNTLNMTHNSNSTGSNIADDTGSSTSLSPIFHAEKDPVYHSNPVAGSQAADELEDGALLECSSDNSNQQDGHEATCDTVQLSQLRKLLEQNLPRSTKNQEGGGGAVQVCRDILSESTLRSNETAMPAINYGLTQASINLDNGLITHECVSKSNSNDVFDVIREMSGAMEQPSMTLENFSMTTSDGLVDPTLLLNVQTQVPSVPASPNARRRAFNFQPISPRNTPTIPENTQLAMYPSGIDHGVKSQISPSQTNAAKHSVGVGPSQPASATNSPFMSPRSTPVPHSRSRHNSGQSFTVFTSRQATPYQNLIDSGVSSIASSPFISPQSTPVPVSARMRNSSGHVIQRTALNRTRHSSGPGGPYNVSVFPVCRSASFSPMSNLPHEGYGTSTGIVSFAAADQGFHFTALRQNSAGSLGSVTTIGTSISSPSEPLSPNVVYADSNSETNEVFQNERRFRVANRRQPRNRHMSSPYSYNPPTGEVFAVQNKSLHIEEAIKSDCEANSHNNSSCYGATNHVTDNTSLLIGQDELNGSSKSYQATPAYGHAFAFASSKASDVLVEDMCVHPPVSGQDVMVSGVEMSKHLESWQSRSVSSLIREEANGIGVRRNLNDFLSSTPLEDDLQTTLEDLRDCDNDFSRFAQELEAMGGTNEDVLP
ncbi:DNA-binding protein RFX5 [Halotydeus destructor]|nr:DNA-binding protein RFX5 [Halotydeus destructor]